MMMIADTRKAGTEEIQKELREMHVPSFQTYVAAIAPLLAQHEQESSDMMQQVRDAESSSTPNHAPNTHLCRKFSSRIIVNCSAIAAICARYLTEAVPRWQRVTTIARDYAASSALESPHTMPVDTSAVDEVVRLKAE